MILPKLLLIAAGLVLLIDFSGFIQSVKHFISRLLTKNKISTAEFSIKPFDCSLCMTFWCSLLYIILAGEFTLVNIFFVCLISVFTDVIRQLILFIKDLCIKCIDKLYDRLI